jgi:hypothetical protein
MSRMSFSMESMRINKEEQPTWGVGKLLGAGQMTNRIKNIFK